MAAKHWGQETPGSGDNIVSLRAGSQQKQQDKRQGEKEMLTAYRWPRSATLARSTLEAAVSVQCSPTGWTREAQPRSGPGLSPQLRGHVKSWEWAKLPREQTEVESRERG